MADTGHQRTLNMCFITIPTPQINHQRIFIINCFDDDWS